MMNNFMNAKVKSCVMLLFAMFLSLSANAIPAKPGLVKQLTLSDGTTVSARLVGDEYGHYWLGTDGKAYRADAATGLFQAVDAQAVMESAKVKRAQANARRAARLAPRKVGGIGNYTGKKKGLIILVNFDGTTFKSANNNALYQRIANEENFVHDNFVGSMYDYFYAQSDGQFELTFDVVGPVEVSGTQAYYGSNDSDGNDLHPAEMVIEALQLADSLWNVNYADYDWNKDGEVEQVYVVYAGKGEADGGASYTIWPHEWDLSSAAHYGDGAGAQTMDDVRINTYACGAELDGTSGSIAGIGTMCHEFSHCLGYPDFYDTDYSGGQGMGYWDLMDGGSYNGDGFQPAGYTSYERWVAGWKEPIKLTSTMAVTGMKGLQEGGESYVIYNGGNSNEYFLLENRQMVGWDASLPGEGLLILHVDYNASSWSNNTPNDDPYHQRMTWIPADNKYQYTTYQGTKYYTFDGMANDTYPYGSVNSFSKTSTPAAKFYNKNTDGTYYMDTSVENITQNADGTISFNFVGTSNVATPTFSPKAGVYSEPQSVTISCDTEGAAIYYTLDGSTPTASSTPYTQPIVVETTTTIKAIAIADGEESAVATGKYVIRTSAGDVNTFKRVESTSDIVSGMRYIIACGSKKTAAGALSNFILTKQDITIDNDIATIDDNVTVFTLNESGTGYSLMNEDGQYLYATTTKKLAYGDDEQLWTLSDYDGGVIMSFGEYGTMLYNVSSPRFTTYTSNPSTSMIRANLYMEYDDGTVTKQDVTMTFSETECTATLGESFDEPTLTTQPEGLEVTYSSSNEQVATVDGTTGEVTLVGIGTTIITASFAGNNTYNEGSATYTLTVKQAPNPDDPTVGTGRYRLITSEDDLESGKNYLLVYEDGSVAYDGFENYRGVPGDVTIEESVIDLNDASNEAVVLVIESSANGNWLIKDGDDYLALTEARNTLNTQSSPTATGTEWAISFTDGKAYINNLYQTAYYLQYNAMSTGLMFRCYKGTQKYPALYKEIEESTQLQKGDVNGDGKIDIGDVVAVVSHILGNTPEIFHADVADWNDDGDINITDATAILGYILSNNE